MQIRKAPLHFGTEMGLPLQQGVHTHVLGPSLSPESQSRAPFTGKVKAETGLSPSEKEVGPDSEQQSQWGAYLTLGRGTSWVLRSELARAKRLAPREALQRGSVL